MSLETLRPTEDTEPSIDQAESFWQKGPVVYQIYPRSFKATGESSEGTIAGITEKLPYLKEILGVDAIWLTPFYESPMVDGGYDVKSYREVDPRFGTMDDFKELIDKAHERGIKVMVDFVPNHMSTQSDWYKEASSSKDNPKSDWFVFRDAKPDGSLPNNWPSEFNRIEIDPVTGKKRKHTEPVWQYVPERDQYVMCTFTKGQVDLNWHNPEVREAMLGEMRLLLDMGVDAFRVDMVTYIGKNPDLLDEPLNPDYDPACGDENKKLLRKYRNSDPLLFKYMQEMADLLDEYDDRFMVTEDYVARDDPVAQYLKYYQNVNPQRSAPFNFETLEILTPRKARLHKVFHDNYMRAMERSYVPTGVLGNHDQSRAASRMGHEAARAAAVTELTLPGMRFVYYGEELGMEDVEIPEDKIDDPHDGRDPGRTPMLWTPDMYAGFSTVEPWLPISPDYKDKNVQAQLEDPHSFLSLYCRLIALRHNSEALRRGKYVPQESGHDDVFSFMRAYGNERFVTITNFSDAEVLAQLKQINKSTGEAVVSSLEPAPVKSTIKLDNVELRPNEAVVVRLA